MPRGRPPTGGLIRLKNGNFALRWTELGVRRQVDLGTPSRHEAERQRAEALLSAPKPRSHEPPTFAAAANAPSNIRTIKERRSRFDRFVLPAIGALPVDQVTTEHVRDILLALIAKGLSRSTVVHVLHDVSAVLAPLFDVGVIPANPCARIHPKRLPFPKVVEKKRMVLTDAELDQYLRWRHPVDAHAEALADRQGVALLARHVGGLRISDALALDWGWINQASWQELTILNIKTRKTRTLELTLAACTYLVSRWALRGCPSQGVIFPACDGSARGKTSWAKALRKDLARCWGLEVWDGVRWVPGRAPTQRERLLLHGDALRSRLDWHSFRRLYVRALADDGVPEQAARQLTSHGSALVHQVYLPEARALPEGAQGNLGAAAAAITGTLVQIEKAKKAKSLRKLRGRTRIRTVDHRLVSLDEHPETGSIIPQEVRDFLGVPAAETPKKKA